MTIRTLLFWCIVGWGSWCQAGQLLLVFTASWCGPCQQFKKDLAEDPALVGDIPVDVMDIEVTPDVADGFKIKSVPTFVLVESAQGEIRVDKELAREVGYKGPQKFKRWLKKAAGR